MDMELSYIYRGGLKIGPWVARAFCLAQPGCCLAKQGISSFKTSALMMVVLCKMYRNAGKYVG